MGFMKPPGIITFALAVLLAGAAVAAKTGLAFPVLADAAFWMLFGAFILLAVASITRGL